MPKAIRPRSTTIAEAPTAEPTTATTTQLRLEVPASRQARFVRPASCIAVTFAKPVVKGRPELITGDVLGTMFARGPLHHYRVAAYGVVWIVPAAWMTPAFAAAATTTKAMQPQPASLSADWTS